MDDHNDDEENQIHTDMDNEEANSDSDGGMEVDCTDDDGEDDIDDKLDSELVDSDVNVEATELTNSDVDLSDESDVKGDLTSDAESNVDLVEREVDGSVIDSEEETFALEMKDTKEDDSGDERYVNDQVDIKNNSPIKNISEDEAKVEKEDNDVEAGKKSTVASDDTNTLCESTNDVESNTDERSSAKVVQKSEELEDEDALPNADSPTSTQHNSEEEPNTNANNIVNSPKTSSEADADSHLVHDTNEQNNNTSPKTNERIMANDETPKFIGFDSEITNKTMQILYILQQNYQELFSQLQTVHDKSDEPSAMEVELEQCTQLNDTNSEHTGSNRHETIAVGEISPQEKQHSDEQGTANKRIKKKRKFFDEFDENDMDTLPKKAKEQRDSTPNVDANLSENKENFMSSDKPPAEDELSVVIPPIPSSVMPSTPNPPTKLETKGKFDITNPDFKEPFKYGWKREVVYRFISEDGQKKSADVSYFTPEGKKLRSIKQINENLPEDGSLHIKNFTFSKELVFRNRESELEVTRFTKKMEAELRTNESPNVSSDHIIDRRLGIEPISTSISLPNSAVDPSRAGDDTTKKTPTITHTSSSSKKKEAQKSKVNVKTLSTSLSHSSETTSKSKSSSKKGAKNITLETDAEEITNATPKLTMPKIMLRGPNVANSNVAASKVTSSGMKIKIASIPSKQSSQKTAKKAPSSSKSNSKNSKSQKRPDKSNTIDSQVGGTVLVSDAKNRDRSSNIKRVRGTQTCSISCPLALGTIPTLQCTICLCLFHFECCGVDADQPVYGYVCKTCRVCERKKENVHPTYNTSLRESSNYSANHYDSLTLSSYRGTIPAPKIVDGVTTWLPSSSNIHLKTFSGSSGPLSNNPSVVDVSGTTPTTLSEIRMPLVQGVLELDGRRYVVVPKQSVLSVSPTSATTIFENHASLCNERTMNTLVRSGSSPISGSGSGTITAANTLLVNPSDVNNAGVVLVPVVPSSNNINSQNLANSSTRYANYYDHHSRLKFPVENSCPSTCPLICNSINGRSPNELGTYQTATSIRVPSEHSSSFTLSNISRIYEPLLMSLKYLTVRDLLRVSMTCKFLNRIASESCLWKTVRLKNSHVHDWKGFAQALQKYGTKRLDMRKMLCSSAPEELNKMWQEFLEVVPSIASLEHIDFSRTPMNVIDTVAATCPNLAVFNALYLKNGSLTLDNFTRLQHLVELKLKGFGGIDLKRNNPQLHFVNKDNLRELSLTCIKNIDMDLLTMISEASNLVTLELGECAQLPSNFVDEIGKLKKLEKLRLERLENLAPDYELLNVVNSMNTLKSLELINIEIKDGFDEVLAQCKNLENFLIIPLYISQSATTNQLVLDGIKSLSDTLKCFVWGLTTELLKVTDLFMDQWQPKSSNPAGASGPGNATNKKSGDSIPVRKLVDKPTSDGDAAPTHVDILPVPKLERILASNLPKSRIKVIKIPFQMTWRQSLSECLK